MWEFCAFAFYGPAATSTPDNRCQATAKDGGAQFEEQTLIFFNSEWIHDGLFPFMLILMQPVVGKLYYRETLC